MLADEFTLLAGAAALLLLLLIYSVASLRSAKAALRDMRDELGEARRLHREAEQACGTARSTGAALEEAVRRLEAEMEAQRTAQKDQQAKHADLQEKHAALQSAHAALQADSDGKLASARERIEELKSLREEMAKKFEDLAAATLRKTGSEFSATHQEKLSELLKPFREHVSRFEVELREVHRSADKERAQLSQQVRDLTIQSETVRSEAAALTRALKGDKQKQGAWGEMILERILEASGLERDVHYMVQQQRTGEDGARYRPDVVVQLPRKKCLIIDSKVSLVSYEAAVNAETEEERAEHLKAHAAAVRRHVTQLADKAYYALEDTAVDYVLMFMPIEGALAAALNEAPDLASFAVSRHIGLMTPTTLMVTLRTVEHIWTVERRESNAEDIAKRAGRLYDKLANFVGDLTKVGDALGKASQAHEEALKKLTHGRGNAISQVETLKQMGARATKSIAIDYDADDEPARLPAAE
ncbi:DNA recombination protein RmuC [Oceanicola granulosus HTCC2516]|uniref:DNA recombination protein RmuC homolog n=1 Tax=Oceanicola granulosus (strain ATCC BAA-861 / DSM 15982 / KCTC 12143 / HTCC2516) TaxID=314256 RepID=Q2CAS5_OCEGH|nr:DNA recombination protein RmuC [Oceanicola granulosus]EAR49763.1 DNA recombination protein RmuC [Oceanicola granulosus HTCC2516]